MHVRRKFLEYAFPVMEKSMKRKKSAQRYLERVINNINFLKESLCSLRSECIHLIRKELHCARTIPRKNILKMCLLRAKVVFSTVSSSRKSYMNLETPFDYLIINEVAQLKVVESTITLYIEVVMRAFLIGDPKQLPQQ